LLFVFSFSCIYISFFNNAKISSFEITPSLIIFGKLLSVMSIMVDTGIELVELLELDDKKDEE
jgi:hypothetical protein